MSKGLKLTISIILGMVLLISIGMNIYAAFFDNDGKCTKTNKCVQEQHTQDETNQSENKIADSNEIANQLGIKVLKGYISEGIDKGDFGYGEEVEVHWSDRLMLLDNGTYSRYFQGDTANRDYGVYYIEGDILYIHSLLEGGNGSTESFQKVETIKYWIHKDGLYDKNNKMVYKVSNNDVGKLESGLIGSLVTAFQMVENSPDEDGYYFYNGVLAIH